ncbi:hypothetical protein AGR4C_pb10001 [Agrobacterium tumefaciens str. Kerr 14]|uniref:Uncharacterized protein n=1 Tax=Agrobacterium tumefaciens str. Kerr 14 TaxID=1183424 RepID=A0A1S7SCR6_AGRTU|nr:hypothetical protein [Agrobacterium tumefaciens]CUX66755.1 hypothetical protein AGR4C_pb10001 [Agrobacterium tumefaciens str. Kerr 14]
MKRFFAVIDKINKIVNFIGMQPIAKDQPRYALYFDRVVMILIILGTLALVAYLAKVAMAN